MPRKLIIQANLIILTSAFTGLAVFMSLELNRIIIQRKMNVIIAILRKDNITMIKTK